MVVGDLQHGASNGHFESAGWDPLLTKSNNLGGDWHPGGCMSKGMSWELFSEWDCSASWKNGMIENNCVCDQIWCLRTFNNGAVSSQKW